MRRGLTNYMHFRQVLLGMLLSAMFLSFPIRSGEFKDYIFEPGHPSLQEWLLPDHPPFPENNVPNEARVELGKMLFFDPGMSGDGKTSCASCHKPALGWADGLPIARGFNGQLLARGTPTIVNTGFNAIQMWDGREHSLESQSLRPMEADTEMNTDFVQMFSLLNGSAVYVAAFKAAYPNEDINRQSVAKAIASFERSVVSNASRFDRWVEGEHDALSAEEVEGFKVFTNPEKGNCSVCHSPPNFVDDGFHNIGLASYGLENPDMGRYTVKALGISKGAFKTPTLRDIASTAPYFHDGSAATLEEGISHYVKGGVYKANLSPNIKALDLSESEKAALLAFLKSLSNNKEPMIFAVLGEPAGLSD